MGLRVGPFRAQGRVGWSAASMRVGIEVSLSWPRCLRHGGKGLPAPPAPRGCERHPQLCSCGSEQGRRGARWWVTGGLRQQPPSPSGWTRIDAAVKDVEGHAGAWLSDTRSSQAADRRKGCR